MKRTRRARAALAWGVLLFAALQAGAFALVRATRPGVVDLRGGELLARAVERERAAHANACRVVFVGSSRFQWGLRARALQDQLNATSPRRVEVFSHGRPGAGPVTNLHAWRRMRREGVRPDLLVVEVVPSLLFDPREPPEASAIGLRDLRLMCRLTEEECPDLPWKWARAWSAPLHAHRQALLSWGCPDLLADGSLALPPDPPDEYGDYRQPVSCEATPAARHAMTHRAHQVHLRALSGCTFRESSCAALKELLDSCRRDGIRTAVLVMPESAMFRAWYRPGVWDVAFSYLQSLCARCDAELINAREWAVPEEEFLDGHHLLDAGARRFTERLGREVLSPRLR